MALIPGVVVFSFSGILISLAGAPGPVSGFYRMTIGWLLLTPWFIKNLQEKKYPLAVLRLPLLAGVFFGGDMVLCTTGIVMAGATIPILFTNTTPLWVGLGALLLFREKLKPGFWVGLALALSGAVMIGGFADSQTEHLVEGIFLGLGAAIFYAGYLLSSQRGRESLDPVSFMWIVSFVASLVLLLATILLKQSLTGYSLNTYLAFLAMGVIVQVGGWQLVSYAQGSLPASLVSPSLLCQAVLTGVIAVPLLGENLGLLEILGGIMVIIGVYLVHRSKLHQNET